MPTYKIRQTWQYTVIVEVEADSNDEALHKSNDEDGERNHDDVLFDAEVIGRE